MEGKKLHIDCGACDATRVTDEALNGYDEIEVNCGAMIVTAGATRILLDHGVRFNTGSVINVPDGVRMMCRTGIFTVEPGDVPSEPTALIVTGKLRVREGAGEALDAYAVVHVIGNVVCPRSLAGRVNVVGQETAYPDGYVYVDDDVKLGRRSVLRWAGKKVFTEDAVIVERDADLDALIASGAVFACGKAVVPESLMDKAMALLELSDDGEIVELPDGAVYVDGSRTLTKALSRRGKRLWIDGSLAVGRREAELLSGFEYLHVEGRAVVPEELEESFLELSPECENVLTYRGELIFRQNYVSIDRSLLERDGFLTVLDCDAVELDGALTDEEIRRGLAIISCDAVLCASGQASAVRSVSEDVDYVGPRDGGRNGEDGDPNTVSVDCGMYSF